MKTELEQIPEVSETRGQAKKRLEKSKAAHKNKVSKEARNDDDGWDEDT